MGKRPMPPFLFPFYRQGCGVERMRGWKQHPGQVFAISLQYFAISLSDFLFLLSPSLPED